MQMADGNQTHKQKQTVVAAGFGSLFFVLHGGIKGGVTSTVVAFVRERESELDRIDSYAGYLDTFKI
jgi:hypothetical protein